MVLNFVTLYSFNMTFCYSSEKNRLYFIHQVNLGNMYYQGLGIERDVEKAKRLYQRAAPKHRNARLLLEELEIEEEKLKENNEK